MLVGVVVTSPLDWMIRRSSSGDASLSSPRSGDANSPSEGAALGAPSVRSEAGVGAAPGLSAAATCSLRLSVSASFFIMLPVAAVGGAPGNKRPGDAKLLPPLPLAPPPPRPLSASSP